MKTGFSQAKSTSDCGIREKMGTIKFGTSGWRAILAEEFTIRNLRIVCQGIAQYLRQEKIGQRGIIIGVRYPVSWVSGLPGWPLKCLQPMGFPH